MPAPKTRSAPTNGVASKGKPSSGNGTPLVTAKSLDTAEPTAVSSSGAGRPDKAAYDAEQEKIKSEIDALQAMLSGVRDKISLATRSGTENDRRATLRAELEGIRGQQSNNKTSRGKVMDQLEALQETTNKRVKDLQAAKAKTPFKTVEEVDNRIRQLDKQVESGSMKLAEEKRALQEISQIKRTRRNVESFQAEQDAIDAERRTADELRKQLDDPEAKAVSDRYDAIKAELDELKKESDEAYASRSKLFEERDNLQAQINTLFNQKRESAQAFRDANDRYWSKLNEDRARRAERARAQRAAEELQKKQEIAERIREEATAPAFQAQIEDCQTLIDYFLGKNSGNVAYSSAPLVAKSDLAAVPKLQLRTVDASTGDGLVVRKKKGEDEVSYFVASKGKGKGKKGGAKPTLPPVEAAGNVSSSTQLNVPLPTLSALLSLSIPPPASSADVPRVTDDLKTKKAWFEANQSRVTAENIAKAEAEIQRLTNGKAAEKTEEASSAPVEVTPPNGGGEKPAEPSSTPQTDGLPDTAIPSEDVVEKLEEVKEEVQE